MKWYLAVILYGGMSYVCPLDKAAMLRAKADISAARCLWDCFAVQAASDDDANTLVQRRIDGDDTVPTIRVDLYS